MQPATERHYFAGVQLSGLATTAAGREAGDKGFWVARLRSELWTHSPARRHDHVVREARSLIVSSCFVAFASVVACCHQSRDVWVVTGCAPARRYCRYHRVTTRSMPADRMDLTRSRTVSSPGSTTTMRARSLR